MSSQFSEIADIPREFLREGTQFVNRCAKPDKREFIKISQAVGVGFVVMGAIGYVVKLSKFPCMKPIWQLRDNVMRTESNG
ncbi:MAG: hypothetical protein Q9196_001519 [Gyalolechia fulgens]